MKTRQYVQQIASGILLTGVTPYNLLKKDDNGFAINSGTASGGQVVNSVRSKIEQLKGRPPMVTLKNPATGDSITMTAAEAEVAFGQTLPELAKLNQVTGTAANT
ncbi:MAG: hypothetical protein HY432_03010 [Candidatus Liptonbacteria bacterium]|nr:hypothetical protein [Candidatus Liptonbacteria bacterium]